MKWSKNENKKRRRRRKKIDNYFRDNLTILLDNETTLYLVVMRMHLVLSLNFKDNDSGSISCTCFLLSLSHMCFTMRLSSLLYPFIVVFSSSSSSSQHDFRSSGHLLERLYILCMFVCIVSTYPPFSAQ